MSQRRSYTLYSTTPHPCSYLAGEEATTQFIDPAVALDGDDHAVLARMGFRRSGQHWYRPHCASCQACIPLRIPVAGFLPSRQQQRTWLRNQDLVMNIADDIRSGEHYRLYERYINTRHRDGDMYPASREQFEGFLASPLLVSRDHESLPFAESPTATLYLELRKGLQLVAVAVTDVFPGALSAVYTFYEPDDSKRSLGVFSVLIQIELARKLGLAHVYLGYWLKQSRKMNYKAGYQPHEILLNGQWQTME